MFQRHRHLYGTTERAARDGGSITFRHHASLNERAVMRDAFGLDDYLDSRFIVEPLHLLDYCLINDGGVALILTPPRRPLICARSRSTCSASASGAS